MINKLIFMSFLFGSVISQAQTNFEVILQSDNSFTRYLNSINQDIILLNTKTNVNNQIEDYIIWHNIITNQTDSIYITSNPSIENSLFIINHFDTLLVISKIKNSHNFLISSLIRNSNQLVNRKIISLDTYHEINNISQDITGNFILYGIVDSNYNALGKRGYPFFLKYNPFLNSISIIYQFERNAFLGNGNPFSLTSINNGGYVMACDGCKKYYHPILVNPSSNGYADISIMNSNFEVLSDTAPIVQNYQGFPFAYPKPRLDGPWRISSLAQLPNNDIILLGLIYDTSQTRFLNQDVLLARWDLNLNKIYQFQFGLQNSTDYIHQFRHLVIGYDGHIYTAFETNSNDSLWQLSNERQKILVSKFDNQLNLLWQETYDSGKHTQFRDMIATMHGVYLTANQRTGNGPFEKATLLRIKNSSPPLSVDPLNAQLTVDLYPNPASSTAYLQAGIPLIGYRILDLSGKLIVEQQTEANKRIEVNTTSLAPGIYLIEAKAADANKRIAIKRLMKY